VGVSETQRGVLLITSERLGDTPAGPGLRSTGLSVALRERGFDVRIAAPAGSTSPEGIPLVDLDRLEGLVREADVVLVPSGLVGAFPQVFDARRLIVDHAGPFELEVLAGNRGPEAFANATLGAIHAIRQADLILVTHERQRDYCAGLLLGDQATSGRATNPLERFAIVPFGLPRETADPVPVRTEGPLRIGWPGGLWDWLDPDTLLDAIHDIPAEVASFEFWGSQNPDPRAPRMATADRLRRRIDAENLADRVEIVDWVPIRDYWARLAGLDLAITLDPAGVEARFAFRTRLLAALRVGVPTIATEGEWVADLAADAKAGWTVPAGDSTSVAALITDLATNRDRICKAGSIADHLATNFDYRELTLPLADWCLSERRYRYPRTRLSTADHPAMPRLRRVRIIGSKIKHRILRSPR
jgi:glycosyltransferase involved in cell wall biosynthesis